MLWQLLLLLLLDLGKVKEVNALPQSVNKLGRLFVSLLCERLAYVVVHLPHHGTEVAGVDMPCQHFTELRDVPGAMATASIGCVSEGCGIAKEEISLLGDGVRARRLFSSRISLNNFFFQLMPFVLQITATGLYEEHLGLVDKCFTHLHHPHHIKEGHGDAVSSVDHILLTVC